MFSDQIKRVLLFVSCFKRQPLRVLLQYNYRIFLTGLSVFFCVFLVSKGNVLEFYCSITTIFFLTRLSVPFCVFLVSKGNVLEFFCSIITMFF